ncbi:MAG: DUF6069 family protein [Thermomicrobiales bacterium]
MNPPSIEPAEPVERTVPTRRELIWQRRALAIVVAVVVNVIILGIGRLANGDLPIAKVGSDAQTIGVALVIGVTALVGILAWVLLDVLERTMTHSRARMIWTAVAVVVFLLSLLGPLGSAQNTYSRVLLVCMHIGAAATIIPLMRQSRR